VNTDIRAAIDKQCQFFLERCRERNAEEPEQYRLRGDMNRYLNYLDKGGWSVPFALSDFYRAKTPLVAHDKFNRVFEDYYVSIGEPFEKRPETVFLSVVLDLTLEKKSVVCEKMAFFRDQILGDKVTVLGPSLERTIALAFTGNKDLLPTVERLIENQFIEEAERLRLSGKAVARLMQIVRAEHLFWSGSAARLAESAKTLMQVIPKTPEKCFKNGGTLIPPMWYDKSYYEAFAWFCHFLTSKPRECQKIERAACMLTYCAIDCHGIDSAELLGIKYYDIIAQMLSGKQAELRDFRREFPVLAQFLQSVADKYRD
jgi:hypothetical protein